MFVLRLIYFKILQKAAELQNKNEKGLYCDKGLSRFLFNLTVKQHTLLLHLFFPIHYARDLQYT